MLTWNSSVFYMLQIYPHWSLPLCMVVFLSALKQSFNSSSVNLHVGVDGGLYTDTICSFVGLEIFATSTSQSQFSAIFSGMNFLFIISATPPPELLWPCQNIDTFCIINIILGVRVSFSPKCVSFSEIILADFIIVLISISLSLIF